MEKLLVNLKQNMKIKLIAFLLLSVTAQGQEYQLPYTPPVCDTSSVWFAALIPRPAMNTSTGVNVWNWVAYDGQHKSVNVDSIAATSSYIRVYFSAKAKYVVGYDFARDESTGAIGYGTYMLNKPQIVSKGYTWGARVFLDYAELTISKPSKVSVWIQWDTVGVDRWVQGSYSPITLPLNSIPFIITNKTDVGKDIDYIELNSINLFAVQGAPTFKVPFSNRDTNYLLNVHHEQVWNALHQLTILDRYGNILHHEDYPHGMRIDMDLGTTEVLVNPLTENFNNLANFWVKFWFIGTIQPSE